MMFALVTVAFAAACSGPPSQQHQQWVARDAWDQTCAEKAMVETWKADNGRWKIKDSVYVVDVDALFRLTDDCQSGLPLVGKQYKTIDKVAFKQAVEISKCKAGDKDGWALPGKEGSRCWTGPKLVP